MKRVLAFLLPVFAGVVVVAAGVCLYWWVHVDQLDLRYVVTVRDPRTGTVDVALEVRGITRPIAFLASAASERDMRLEGFSASSATGARLSTGSIGPKRFVISGLRHSVAVRYSVTPGALDRHGHQGLVTRDFGLVPGRVLFLLPTSRARARSALVRFSLPAGWTAVHPFESRDGLWFDASLDGGYLEDSLVRSSIGFGRWVSDRSPLGATRFEVHAFAGWPDELTRRVIDHARSIFAAFQQQLGFRLEHKVVAIFVPAAPDGNGIIAGYWSNGLGHDMDDTEAAWSLFAHRIAHIFFRDAPHGVRFKEAARYEPVANVENWVNEGLATFLEVWAVNAAGLSNANERLDELWTLYLDRRLGDRRLDLPLSQERPQMAGEDRDYLHYVKALLFMENLDARIRQRSLGAKSLAGFLGEMYKRSADRQLTLPLIESLEQYAGSSVGDFFDRYAIQNQTLLPAWDGFLERYGETLPPRLQAALTAAREEGDPEGQRHVLKAGTEAGGSLTPVERQTAVRIARDAIDHYHATGRPLVIEPARYQLTERLRRPALVFVTVRIAGRQRGCMGALNGEVPLFLGIARAAIAAAYHDPRYPPLSGRELEKATIDVSVLSPDRQIRTIDEIALGRDGLILRAEGRRAYFLPYVPEENGWDRDETLAQLGLKAGLRRDAWKAEGTELRTFTAQTFSE